MLKFDFVGYTITISKGKVKYINDLVVIWERVIERYNEETGEMEQVIIRTYFDILADGSENDDNYGKNDFYFVQSGFFRLYEEIKEDLKKIDTLFMVSDNAGKHFKNRRTIKWFSVIWQQLLKILIIWILYAEFHGYSLNDSHGGIVTQIITRESKNGNLPDTQSKLAELIKKNVKIQRL